MCKPVSYHCGGIGRRAATGRRAMERLIISPLCARTTSREIIMSGANPDQ